jgi:hypothetical protein
MELGTGNRNDRSSSPLSRSTPSSFRRFYINRELILFNRNILIAAITSIIADAIVVNYAAQITNNSIVLSVVSMITDSGVCML